VLLRGLAQLSLSLGCKVVAFEPVRAYQDVLRLAVHLNGPSYRERLTLYGNAIFDAPGAHQPDLTSSSSLDLTRLET
jgi:hypothetical protein